ncbi:MAG: DUF4126 domain-containing protein [Chloroflexota bacterium]
MNKNKKNLYLRAAVLGVIAGMRSASAPAVISQRAATAPEGFKGTPFGWLSNAPIRPLFMLSAIGELIVDKLPFVGSRIAPGPLVVRAMSGAFVGSAAFAEADESLAVGAVTGALGAIASSYAFYYTRRTIAQILHIPDLPVALAEDAATVGAGSWVLKTYE